MPYYLVQAGERWTQNPFVNCQSPLLKWCNLRKKALAPAAQIKLPSHANLKWVGSWLHGCCACSSSLSHSAAALSPSERNDGLGQTREAFFRSRRFYAAWYGRLFIRSRRAIKVYLQHTKMRNMILQTVPIDSDHLSNIPAHKSADWSVF